MEAPVYLTGTTVRGRGHITEVGPAAQLAAFATGSPVTLSGKHAGERVYLGHTRQIWDDGITVETICEDRTWTHEGQQIAAYLIDLSRLHGAPRLCALVTAQPSCEAARAAEVEARAAADEAELERSEDGT